MEFNITFILPISPENAALIPIVASMTGWDGEGSAADHICSKVKPQIEAIPQYMFYNALDAYFGFAGKETADAAKTAYEENAVCTVSLQ